MSRHTVHVAVFTTLGIALCLGLVALFLTHTQVGREALKQEIESAFNDEFQGKLHIGKLTGNLVYDLFASDITLSDTKNQTVAHIDSLVLKPKWMDLLRDQITVSTLTLFRPKIDLIHEKDGKWNIEKALESRKKSQPRKKRIVWTLAGAEVNVREGKLAFQNEGNQARAVQEGQVFDFENAHISGLNLSASVDWRPTYKLIDLTGLSAELPQYGFTLRQMEGQVLLDEHQTALNHLSIRTNGSTLKFSANATGSNFAKKPFAPSLFKNAPFTADIQTLSVNAAEWERLFPKLKLYDFTASLNASGRTDGETGTFEIPKFALNNGQSTLAGSANVRLHPDSVAFAADLPQNNLTISDFSRWFSPNAPIQKTLSHYQHLQRVELQFKGKGVVSRKENVFQITSDVVVNHPQIGFASGKVSLNQAVNAPLQYALDLKTERLNVGYIQQDANLTSNFTGQTRLTGTGTDLGDLDAKMRIRLKNVRFDSFVADSLRMDGTFKDKVFDGIAFLNSPHGAITTNGKIFLHNLDKPQFDLKADTKHLDISWLLNDPSVKSDLTAMVDVKGSGNKLNNFKGELNLNLQPSSITSKGKTTNFPQLASNLSIQAFGDKGSIVRLRGDIADADIRSEMPLDLLAESGQYWLDAIVRTNAQESAKQYHTDAAEPFVLNTRKIDLAHQKLADKFRSFKTLPQTTAFLKVHRSAFLTSLIPNLPYFDESTEIQLKTSSNADQADFDLALKGDSLAVGTVKVRNFDLHLLAHSTFAYNLAHSLSGELSGDVDTLAVSTQGFKKVDVNANYQHGGGQIFLKIGQINQLGSGQLWANLDLLKDRNQLTFVDLSLDNPKYAWTIPSDQVVDLYTDAIVLKDVLVERKDSSTANNLKHRLVASGVLSSDPSDAVIVKAENIRLLELSDLIGSKTKIGGMLFGEVTLKDILHKQDISGNLFVENLSISDKHVAFANLGKAEANLQFIPESNLIGFELAIKQDKTPNPTTIIADNDVLISGNLGLPLGKKSDGSKNNGLLDLNVDFRKLDLWFFKMLFPGEVDKPTGWGRGLGQITGDFAYPIFNAQLNIAQSNFDVPYYKLNYNIAGDISVDEKGIHLEDMLLSDKTGGRGIVRGDILFNRYKFFSFDLSADLDKLQIINVPFAKDLDWYGNLWASGPLTMSGPLSHVVLDAPDVTMTKNSQLFIPLTGSSISKDDTFITMTDPTGKPPAPIQRSNLLSNRATGERTFLDGLDMRMNIHAPLGSTINLVMDPLLNDVIHAVGSGDLQMDYTDASFKIYGDFNIDSGDYLFTAFNFIRKPFKLDKGGKMTWTGDAINAKLDIPASYRVNASTKGIQDYIPELKSVSRVPIRVNMGITGDVNSPIVDLTMGIDRDIRTGQLNNYDNLEAELNNPDRATTYAASVLLTNSFVLSEALTNPQNSSVADTGNQLVFTSLTQLASSYINRLVNQVLPNADVNLGIYQGNNATDLKSLGLSAGIALRFLDEKIVVRGEGQVQNVNSSTSQQTDSINGEVTIEYRVSPNLSLQIFYRRNNQLVSTDALSGRSVGIGFNLQRTFSNWKSLFAKRTPPPPAAPDSTKIVAFKD